MTRILATDYDGTLKYAQKVMPEDLQAIQRWKEAGNLFVIVTGRSMESIKRQSDLYQLPVDYFVTNNGGMVFDSKGKELYCGCVSKGSFTGSEVPIRKIVELCMRYNAYSAIIAHNHPSGSAVPSKNDIIVTRKLISTLDLIGCRLNDHIIVADGDYVSLEQSEILGRLFYSED